ncbi:hypothetical protein PIB30_080433 [Stylosanthes scabra]|uniref:Putative plant transposon protein domain-containing protein n=1 Tax=Stylosanthes scabra TaxID=79078 RepID=A0ABU6STL6_9FABA|nr:hypothetical protein [Stylosanthes scabra]
MSRTLPTPSTPISTPRHRAARLGIHLPNPSSPQTLPCPTPRLATQSIGVSTTLSPTHTHTPRDPASSHPPHTPTPRRGHSRLDCPSSPIPLYKPTLRTSPHTSLTPKRRLLYLFPTLQLKFCRLTILQNHPQDCNTSPTTHPPSASPISHTQTHLLHFCRPTSAEPPSTASKHQGSQITIAAPFRASLLLEDKQPSSLVWQAHSSLDMASSSSDILDAYCFRSQYHQDLFEEHLAKKSVTPETCFEMKFYANAVRTKEEVASGENYPYQSYVRGVTIDFPAANIRDTLRIRHLTPGAQTDFKTRQMEDQRLDEVEDEFQPAQSTNPIEETRSHISSKRMGRIHHPLNHTNRKQVRNHSAREIFIHSIIKGEDVRVEELISDNIAIVAEGVQGRGKLIFPSTIYRLCKEAGVSFREFRGTEYIPIEKPITARVMVKTRGRNAKYTQEQHMEEEYHMQPNYNEAEY